MDLSVFGQLIFLMNRTLTNLVTSNSSVIKIYVQELMVHSDASCSNVLPLRTRRTKTVCL
jgi:hypothetical protein